MLFNSCAHIPRSRGVSQGLGSHGGVQVQRQARRVHISRNSARVCRFTSSTHSKTDLSQVTQRMTELNRILQHANHAYYNQSRPVMEDAQYDQFFAELSELERKYPECILPNSATTIVGAPVPTSISKAPSDVLQSPSKEAAGRYISTLYDSNTSKISHDLPMLSVSSIFSMDDLYRFTKTTHKAHLQTVSLLAPLVSTLLPSQPQLRPGMRADNLFSQTNEVLPDSTLEGTVGVHSDGNQRSEQLKSGLSHVPMLTQEHIILLSTLASLPYSSSSSSVSTSVSSCMSTPVACSTVSIASYTASLLAQSTHKVLDLAPPSFSVEHKYDGLALSIKFRDSHTDVSGFEEDPKFRLQRVLEKAITRGNGDEGEDVTAHTTTTMAFPNGIPLSDFKISNNEVFSEISGKPLLHLLEDAFWGIASQALTQLGIGNKTKSGFSEEVQQGVRQDIRRLLLHSLNVSETHIGKTVDPAETTNRGLSEKPYVNFPYEVRGEALMLDSVFNHINNASISEEVKYTSARNLASGILHRDLEELERIPGMMLRAGRCVLSPSLTSTTASASASSPSASLTPPSPPLSSPLVFVPYTLVLPGDITLADSTRGGRTPLTVSASFNTCSPTPALTSRSSSIPAPGYGAAGIMTQIRNILSQIAPYTDSSSLPSSASSSSWSPREAAALVSLCIDHRMRMQVLHALTNPYHNSIHNTQAASIPNSEILWWQRHDTWRPSLLTSLRGDIMSLRNSFPEQEENLDVLTIPAKDTQEDVVEVDLRTLADTLAHHSEKNQIPGENQKSGKNLSQFDTQSPHDITEENISAIRNMIRAQCGNNRPHILEGLVILLAKRLAARAHLPFCIDGQVIKADSLLLRNLLLSTSRAPRWAVAYKFPATTATTILESISLQVGRTGRVTPVAHLAPIMVSNALVAKASLHNHDIITYGPLKGMNIGDVVLVERRGDVIPAVTSIIQHANKENPEILGTSETFDFADSGKKWPVGTPVVDTLPHRDTTNITSSNSTPTDISTSTITISTTAVPGAGAGINGGAQHSPASHRPSSIPSRREWLCPCAERSVLVRKENGDGQASTQLFCVSPTCAHQWPRALAHFASKAGIDVAGVSSQTIYALIEEGLLEASPASIARLYYDCSYRTRLYALAGVHIDDVEVSTTFTNSNTSRTTTNVANDVMSGLSKDAHPLLVQCPDIQIHLPSTNDHSGDNNLAEFLNPEIPSNGQNPQNNPSISPSRRPGWGLKKVQNLLLAIARAHQSCTLDKLLRALNIPLLGGSTSRAIVSKFPTLQALLHASTDDFMEINGVGPSLAVSLPKILQKHVKTTFFPLAMYGVPCLRELITSDQFFPSKGIPKSGSSQDVTIANDSTYSSSSSSSSSLNTHSIAPLNPCATLTPASRATSPLTSSLPSSTPPISGNLASPFKGDIVITGTFAITPLELHTRALNAFLHGYVAVNAKDTCRDNKQIWNTMACKHADTVVTAATGINPSSTSQIPDSEKNSDTDTPFGKDEESSKLKLAKAQIVLSILRDEWNTIDADQLVLAEERMLLDQNHDLYSLSKKVNDVVDKWAGNGFSSSDLSSHTTATLPSKVSREIVSKIATSLGIAVSSRVHASATHALVSVGSGVTRESSKIVKARNSGVTIRDEEWLLEIIGCGRPEENE